jgi:hypothetical protein
MKRHKRILFALLIAIVCASCGQQTREPAPEQQNVNGQWIDPSKIQPGPIQHEFLPDDMVKRVKAVQAVFAEVDQTPPEKWIEDFKRDMNPERELAIWEAMAGAFTAYNHSQNLPLSKRKELFGILLTRSSGSTEDALRHLKLKTFTEAEAREAMDLLAKEWEKRNSPTKPSTATE